MAQAVPGGMMVLFERGSNTPSAWSRKGTIAMMGNTDVAFRIASDVMRERHADAARDRRVRESRARRGRTDHWIARFTIRLPKVDQPIRFGTGRTETA